MRRHAGRLVLGLFLMAVCGALLVASDLNRRARPGRELPQVSLFQFASRDVLDDSVRGCLEGLAARGYEDGKTIRLRRYNAEGELATAHAVASAIRENGSRLVVTFSTPALQVMAGANRDGRLPHVFATVTDPFGSGVGLSREHPETRPAHLAGIGSFQPVKEVWRLARRVNPGLRSVGVVWCTSETCSEACTRLAREAAAELGIRLLENPIVTSTEIPEAVRALLARDVEALWIGGDNIVEMAAPTVIALALQAGIPVFANAPSHAGSGALLALGADYVEVGRLAGGLAADVLEGRSPADIPVENRAPPQLAVNLEVLGRLKHPERWTPGSNVLARAWRVIGEPAPAARSAP